MRAEKHIRQRLSPGILVAKGDRERLWDARLMDCMVRGEFDGSENNRAFRAFLVSLAQGLSR